MFEKVLRVTLTALLKALFRVEVRGLEHYHALKDKRAVIIANHQSYLDPLLLAVFIPEKPAFAMNAFQAKKWYFKPMIALLEVYKIDPTQPMSTKSLIRCLHKDKKVVVFPEGRITRTGGVMKIYEGTGMIIERTGAAILPVRVEGAQHSLLSRMKGKDWRVLLPKITLTIEPPQYLELPDNVKGRKRRALATQRIYDLMCAAEFHAANYRTTLLQSIAEASTHGMGRMIATDITRTEMNYRSIWTRSFVLSGKLESEIGTAKNIAVMLPTSLGGMVTFLALHLLGRTPAMLNFSAGARNNVHACKIAGAEVVLTSRAFVEKGKLQPLVEAMQKNCRIIYLEDFREKITLGDKLGALAKTFFLTQNIAKSPAGETANDPAAILFTSGSEGVPKGVVLSHSNLLANIAQARSRLYFTQQDVMFNAMPIFHSFGLTAGMLLPLVLGIRVFFYPSPLHYRVVPELCYDSGATILLGTDTFYGGYARYAQPFDFHTVRLAVAGAEKLKDKTRQLYADRFGVNIYEGYGVTETSPVLSCNTPLERKVGTVGRFLPEVNWKLDAIEGLEQGGRLYVNGPNVMLGYLSADRPGEIQPQDKWYDTGDIVTVDEEGFISITGRAKRFAKIGGEMVSLAAVEECASRLWSEHTHAAIAKPDSRKGEVIVLLSENPKASREEFLAHAKAEDLPDIMLPRKVGVMEEIPRLGTGKIDYMRLKEIEGET